jgi:hypothetical protein
MSEATASVPSTEGKKKGKDFEVSTLGSNFIFIPPKTMRS